MDIKELQTSVEQLAIRMFPKGFNKATTYYFFQYIGEEFNAYAGSIECDETRYNKTKTLKILQDSCYRITKNIVSGLVPDNEKLNLLNSELYKLFAEYYNSNDEEYLESRELIRIYTDRYARDEYRLNSTSNK